MPKASRRKRLTRPPKWTRRPKPKEPVTDPAEAVPFPVDSCPPACPNVIACPVDACTEAPVVSLPVTVACPEEPEIPPLPQPHNIAVPVQVPLEDFPTGDNDIPLLRNTDDLIQCLKDHLKKWKEP